MNLNAKEICLTERWHRIAFFVFGITFSVALLPMLVWPQSTMARGFCIAAGVIGLIALVSLGVAAARHVIAPSPAPDNTAT
ncbi:hypothetical protein [Novipirellula artificiosorum]|uniref:Uncharacterized protein n=1 Tax=Novipirellula artificiosorum TaxID=2528016 RepID=A0A5C6D2P8_9BACT|nr:hypothetical protein [Novipirellula artificiosorum]TWU31110.1 hypothetical protein Poly41_63000 [Novipirellula artificiosorum]